jgi:hypothetical protein
MIKYLSAAACMLALLGFLFPALLLEVNLLGQESRHEFGLLTFFRTDNQLRGLDIPQTDLFGSPGGGGLLADTGFTLLTSAGAYALTLLLLAAALAMILLGKLRKTRAALLALTLPLFAYAGYSILTVIDPLIAALESAIGFFALFIDLSRLAVLRLGMGYWLTLGAALCVLALQAHELLAVDKARVFRYNKK